MADFGSPAANAAAPSAWVTRFAALAAPGCAVLDVAAGTGRHTRWFLDAGHPVTAVDRDVSSLADLNGHIDAAIFAADLEAGRWPSGISEQQFGCVVVTNYLHRPLLPWIVAAVAPHGVLLYETFAQGNERFGHPRNPEFLLRPGELLEAVRGELTVVAYEHGEIERDSGPAVVQRIAAVRGPARPLP
ncbi:MAG: class I SAM-dependent methyltransferase [Proteobacteria bacterium]|nr:class I SAM-dependent methyltransferase [Pseudomonadota bacterium]MDA1132814.1 class I SAM-dependent methyltransferase [Pseudomonadota bacterium]